MIYISLLFIMLGFFWRVKGVLFFEVNLDDVYSWSVDSSLGVVNLHFDIMLITWRKLMELKSMVVIITFHL